MELDDRGIPVTADDALCAPHCPPAPCRLCTGYSCLIKERTEDGRAVYFNSWEWCRLLDTCAATVDWDRLYGNT